MSAIRRATRSTRRHPSVRITPQAPKRATSGQIRAIVDEFRRGALRTIENNKNARGTGRERVQPDFQDDDELRVTERQAAMSAVELLAGRRELKKGLPRGRSGAIVGRLLKDLERIDWERGKLDGDFGDDLKWFRTSSTPVALLRETAKRRAAGAAAAVAAMVAGERSAYDASNNNLLALQLTDDAQVKANILTDSLLQYRAKRRSAAKIDQRQPRGGGEVIDDNTQGRLPASGPLAALESRLAAQQLSTGRGFDAEREYALTRLAVSNHPTKSLSNIYRARNLTIDLDNLGRGTLGRDFMPVYSAIHTTFSANTPNVVDTYTREFVYAKGPTDRRVEVLTHCVEALSAPDLKSARARLGRLGTLGLKIPAADKASKLEAFQQAVVAFVLKGGKLPTKLARASLDEQIKTLRQLKELHATVCFGRPTDQSLTDELGFAGAAHRKVAAFVHQLREGEHRDAVAAAGAARRTIRRAFAEAGSGFERSMLWQKDREIEALSAELLGVSVKRAQAAAAARDPQGLDELLWATRSAMESVIASGLHQLRADRKHGNAPDMQAVLKEINALLRKRSYSVDEARGVLAEAFAATNEVVTATRQLFTERSKAIHFAGIDVKLDHEFTDHLVKETPLHYLLSLTETGKSFGIETEISANKIRFIDGMRVMNSTGPAVYKRILFARDMERLQRFKPTEDDWVHILRPQSSGKRRELAKDRMLSVGGMSLDIEDAPSGYSHMMVYAKGHGISMIATPEARTNLGQFLRRAKQNKGELAGLYVDDRDGQILIMPLKDAVKEGVISKADIPKLRPGNNRDIDIFDMDGKIEESHSVRLSKTRDVDRVELYKPDLTNRHDLGTVVSFAQLRKLPFSQRRHLAGEKAAVLSHLSGLEALKKYASTPDGGSIPPYAIAELLGGVKTAGGTLAALWTDVWKNDPVAGDWQGTDPAAKDHFTKSRFYTDGAYRQETVRRIQGAVKRHLRKHLIDASGRPTEAGEALIAEVNRVPALKKAVLKIARSSMVAEDRPFKSGAGQYSSKALLVTDAQTLDGILTVIASAWNPSAVENNVSFGANLEHVWPSVLLQPCLKPEISGVATSRGPHGELGEVSYQAVKGLFGGVHASRAEEGSLDSDGTQTISRRYGKRPESLLTAKQQEKLRQAVLLIEKEFNETIEPGRKFAVDVEWALVKGKLHIVQARVLVGI